MFANPYTTPTGKKQVHILPIKLKSYILGGGRKKERKKERKRKRKRKKKKKKKKLWTLF
jgi:hypothetical protein